MNTNPDNNIRSSDLANDHERLRRRGSWDRCRDARQSPSTDFIQWFNSALEKSTPLSPREEIERNAHIPEKDHHRRYSLSGNAQTSATDRKEIGNTRDVDWYRNGAKFHTLKAQEKSGRMKTSTRARRNEPEGKLSRALTPTRPRRNSLRSDEPRVQTPTRERRSSLCNNELSRKNTPTRQRRNSVCNNKPRAQTLMQQRRISIDAKESIVQSPNRPRRRSLYGKQPGKEFSRVRTPTRQRRKLLWANETDDKMFRMQTPTRQRRRSLGANEVEGKACRVPTPTRRRRSSLPSDGEVPHNTPIQEYTYNVSVPSSPRKHKTAALARRSRRNSTGETIPSQYPSSPRTPVSQPILEQELSKKFRAKLYDEQASKPATLTSPYKSRRHSIDSTGTGTTASMSAPTCTSSPNKTRRKSFSGGSDETKAVPSSPAQLNSRLLRRVHTKNLLDSPAGHYRTVPKGYQPLLPTLNLFDISSNPSVSKTKQSQRRHSSGSAAM